VTEEEVLPPPLPPHTPVAVAAAVDQLEQQQQRQLQQELSLELSSKIYKYHSGERGILNSTFLTGLPEWIQHCSSKGEQ